MLPPPPSSSPPPVMIMVILYRGESYEDVHALGKALMHIYASMKPRAQAVVCARVGPAARHALREYEDLILTTFEAKGGVRLIRSGGMHAGQAVMASIAALGGCGDNHWVVILHKPMRLYGRLFSQVACALKQASTDRDMAVVRLVKFCRPGEDHVVPNDNSVFDPNLYECFINGRILSELVDTAAGRYLAWCPRPGWNCSLLYYSIGDIMFSDEVDPEKAGFVVEVQWLSPPLEFVDGDPVETPLYVPVVDDGATRDAIERFYHFDPDLKQLQYPIKRTTLKCVSDAPMGKWPPLSAERRVPAFDPDENRTRVCREVFGMAFGREEALLAPPRPRIYTDEEARVLYLRTAGRVGSVIFVYMLGWLSFEKQWRMLTVQLASSAVMRPYVNRYILDRVDEAARYCPAVRTSISRMLSLDVPKTTRYISEALRKNYKGDSSELVRLLRIQKLELEKIVRLGRGKIIGGMQSFSVLYYLYLSRRRRACPRHTGRAETTV